MAELTAAGLQALLCLEEFGSPEHVSSLHAFADSWERLEREHAALLEMSLPPPADEVLEQSSRAPAASAQHSDDVAVDRFAAAMKEKLAAKRAQGYEGWDDPERCEVAFLSRLLRDHIAKGDPVDVANFAMMLHQRGSGILPSEPASAGIAQVGAQICSISTCLRVECLNAGYCTRGLREAAAVGVVKLDEVICPNCAHQFRAISMDDQERIAALERQLAERAQWVRCSERLPDVGEWVLSHREGERGVTMSMLVSDDPESSEPEEWAAPDGRTTVTSHAYLPPTHWQPLAAAPDAPR